MCRNGNGAQLNIQERNLSDFAFDLQEDHVNAPDQQQEGQLQNDQLNIPQVSPLQQHMEGLKKDQVLLKQAHEEYSYDVIGQVSRYIHPRVSQENRWNKDEVRTITPTFDYMAKAYSMTGFKLADSMEKKYKMLKAAEGRKKLQDKYSQKIEDAAAHPVQEHRQATFSMKEAMKLSDEQLVNNYGVDYLGPGREYIDIRYSLMKNPFYSIMPVDELKKIPRRELLKKLDKEYSLNDKKRGTIIALYEDLIKLQILEKQEGAAARRNPQNAPASISQKERKDNVSHTIKIKKEIRGYSHLTDEEKTKRQVAVDSVMDSNVIAFWSDKDEADKAGVTDEQKEGVRAILAWMYRNCGVGKAGSQEAFVYKLTQAKPKQQLFMLYLIENGMTASPDAEFFDTALKNYIPDPKAKAFKKKPDWTAISQALDFVSNCEEFNEFLESEKEETEQRKNLQTYSRQEAGGEDMSLEKDAALIRMADAMLRKLVAMYNAAGLAPDMPSDLISDPVLKQHVANTVREFEEVSNRLQELHLNIQAVQDAGADPLQTDKSPDYKNKGMNPSTLKKADEKSKYVKAGVDVPKNIFSIMGDDASIITKNLPYAVATGGLSVLFGVAGALFKTIELIKLDTNGLSGVEAVSKRMNLSGGALKGGADFIKGIADITRQTEHFDPSKYKTFTDLIATGPGGLKFAAGTISVVAGGLQTISGSIDLRQASNSQKHLNKAKEHLNNKTEQDIRQSRNEQKDLKDLKERLRMYTEEETMLAGLTEEQIKKLPEAQRNQIENRKIKIQEQKRQIEEQKRQLEIQINQAKKKEIQRKEIRSLIKHRENMTENKKNSAMVNMTGGILTMAGGALTMTGLLAPLGGILSIAGSAISIGLGIIHARWARNKAVRDAVDDGLKLTTAVKKVMNYFNIRNLSLEQFEQLEDRVRQEALAELNYSGYKVCYLDMCKKSASLLYNKVMIKPAERGMQGYTNTEEYKMYYETLKSIGFEQIKRAERPFQTNNPTAEQIYNTLTKGVA